MLIEITMLLKRHVRTPYHPIASACFSNATEISLSAAVHRMQMLVPFLSFFQLPTARCDLAKQRVPLMQPYPIAMYLLMPRRLRCCQLNSIRLNIEIVEAGW